MVNYCVLYKVKPRILNWALNRAYKSPVIADKPGLAVLTTGTIIHLIKKVFPSVYEEVKSKINNFDSICMSVSVIHCSSWTNETTLMNLDWFVTMWPTAVHGWTKASLKEHQPSRSWGHQPACQAWWLWQRVTHSDRHKMSDIIIIINTNFTKSF